MSDVRRGSLRWRITVGATAIVLFALVITALAVSGLLRRSIDSNTEDLLTSRVAAVSELAGSGDLGSVLESTGREVGQVQVVDANGVIVSRTSGLADSTRFDVVPAPPVGATVVGTVEGGRIDNDPSEQYRLIARTVATAQGPLTVYAVTSLDPAADAQQYLQSRLLVALPLLALFTGAVIFWVVGQALKPVEQMRRQVEQISADDRGARVHAPERSNELLRLGGTLNGLLTRLESAADQQREFAANASHELRSPLSAMRTDLEVGLAYPARTDWERTATDALIEIDRLERLALELRSLTTAGHGRDGGASVSCDMNEVVRREVERRSNDMLRIETQESPLVVALTADSVVQITRNLLDNAERHAATSVSVSVARSDDGYAELAVGNDGPAVGRDDRERIFRPFTRLDEARSLDEGGAGLGLAIVRAIVTSAGGSIVADDPDVGVRFVVRLPCQD